MKDATFEFVPVISICRGDIAVAIANVEKASDITIDELRGIAGKVALEILADKNFYEAIRLAVAKYPCLIDGWET